MIRKLHKYSQIVKSNPNPKTQNYFNFIYIKFTNIPNNSSHNHSESQTQNK